MSQSAYSLYHSTKKIVHMHTEGITEGISVGALNKSNRSRDNMAVDIQNLRNSLGAIQRLRQNSPTFQRTDTINQSNIDIVPFKPSLKQTIYSHIDHIADPIRKLHTASPEQKEKLALYNGERIKSGGEFKNNANISPTLNWKPSIKIDFQQYLKRGVQIPVKERKHRRADSNLQNPITTPNSYIANRVRKSVKENQQPSRLHTPSPGRKMFEHSNSSIAFTESLSPGKQKLTQQKRHIEDPYGLSAKQLLNYSYGPKFREEQCGKSCKRGPRN